MNITITDLRALDGDSLVAVHLLIQSEQGDRDARTYRITAEQYAAMRLRCGETDAATVDALEEAEGVSEAIRAALRLLSYGRQSEKTLRRKLQMRGISPARAEEAIAYLHRHGCIRESEEAMRIAESCRRKHWGRRRILSHLFEKGYPEEIVCDVRDALEEEDFVPDCIAHIRAKYRCVPQGREEQQKMTASLVRYGYSLGEIHRAMERMMREDEA